MEGERIKAFIVAGVVLKQDGRYLLVQEKLPKAYGLWNFPAGKVDVGQTIESTAVKEAKEECGYDVELVRKIAIFQKTAEEAVKHLFEAKIVGGDLRFPEDEIMDAQWFTWEEIQGMRDRLRADWIMDSISVLEQSR